MGANNNQDDQDDVDSNKADNGREEHIQASGEDDTIWNDKYASKQGEDEDQDYDMVNRDIQEEDIFPKDVVDEIMQHEHSEFTPNPEMDYGYDDEMNCMVYTGPDFEVGELVDAMKVEPTVQTETIQCWEQAKIVDESSDHYVLSFIRDDDIYMRMIKKDVYRTCMFRSGTHTYKNKWRYQNPQKLLNLMVEYYSENLMRWVQARVMSSMTSMNDKVDMVALQTFPDPDDMTDTSSSEFPQLSVRSPLIRLIDGKLKYFNSNEEIELGLMNVPLYDRPAGPSGPPGSGSSTFANKGTTSIRKILIDFIVQNKYDEISFIRAKECLTKNPDYSIACLVIPLTVLEYVKNFGKLQEHYDYSEKMLSLLEMYIIEGRCFTIKGVDSSYTLKIFQVVADMLKSPKPMEMKKRITYTLLQAHLDSLNMESLNKRVTGVKEIESIATKIFRGVNSPLKIDELGEWLSENKVIHSIYGSQHHSELITRSRYIIKTLCRSKVGIKEEEYKMIWNLTKRDKQTKKEIFTVLQDVGDSLSKEFASYIMERITEQEQLGKKDLEFIYSFKNKSDEQLEITWKILDNSEHYPESVISTAFEKLVDITKFVTISRKLATINKCIENIRQSKSSLLFIKVLKATINHTNLSTAKVQNMAEDFEKAKDLVIEAFFEDFQTYCSLANAAMDEHMSLKYSAKGERFIDQFTHEEHIKERLNFIKELYQLYKIKMSKDQVDLLWRLLAVESLTTHNYGMFFKWFNEQVNNMGTRKYSILTDEILEDFFLHNLLHESNDFSSLEIEGFYLIKNLFKIINEKEHMLQALDKVQGKTEHGTISGAAGTTLSSTSYNKQNQGKEFIIYVHPQEMKGYSTLWKIISDSHNNDVIAECIHLVSELHHNISDIICDRREEIEEDLLKKCINIIEQHRQFYITPIPEDYEGAKRRLEEHKKDVALRQMERMFLHIKSFMDNSEKDGLGNFTMFSSIYNPMATEIILKVHNKINWGSGAYNNKKNPKKFIFKVSSGITLWNLKQYLSEKLDIDPVACRLEKIGLHSRSYKDSENSKTLNDLGICNDDKLNILTKMPSNMIDHYNLLFSDQTLTPEADRLFTEIFTIYTNEDGLMGKQNCIDFLKVSTKQNTDESDPRIARLFDGYDHDKDGFITCDNFKEFYKDSIIKKESVVWNNIRSWGYKTDLKQGQDRPKRDPRTLMRYVICKKRDYFNYFLKCLNDCYEISSCAWKLITSLFVDDNILNRILTLTETNEEGDSIPIQWDSLVNSDNPYQLLYLFKIINLAIGLKRESQYKVRVMFNDADDDEIFNTEDLTVSGSGILKNSPDSVNPNVPTPTPAVPINKGASGKQVTFETAESSEGRAVNVQSASTNADVPAPPPPPGGFEDPVPPNEAKSEPKITVDDFSPGYSVKVYPPGGQQVSNEEAENLKKQSEDRSAKPQNNSSSTQANYDDFMKTPLTYIHDLYKENLDQWACNFVETGGLTFLANFFIGPESLTMQKVNEFDVLTDEEKYMIILNFETLFVYILTALFKKQGYLDMDENSPLQQVKEDQEMQPDDAYELDEEQLLKNVQNKEPSRKRTISAIARQQDEEDLHKIKVQSAKFLMNSDPTLCNAMTTQVADYILSVIDCKGFVQTIINVMIQIQSRRSCSMLDKKLLQNFSNTLQLTLVLYEPSLKILYSINDDKTETDLKEFIIRGITFSSDTVVKEIFTSLIRFICTRIKYTTEERLPIMVILEIMKQHFFERFTENSRYYGGLKEFYSLFTFLIQTYLEVQRNRNPKFENIIEPEIFLKQLINILKSYKTKEKRNTVLEDHCLIGIFEVINCILIEKPQFLEEAAIEYGLLNELWFNCLFQPTLEAPNMDVTPEFDMNSTDLHTNKCKTRESRAKAYALLSLLCTHSEKVRNYIYKNCLQKMFHQIERPENFSTKPESDSRSFYSYAGLKNQGATCYMNSMVQQLYMIPTFKYLFLSINDGKDEDLNSIDNEKSIYYNKMFDDNLLHQFQYTLSFLELTERPFYNALGLCFAMKDWDGQPTNCSLQQDSHEYVNITFDRLEEMIKPTPQRHLFKDIFSAKQCTHMTCGSCHHVKQRIEDYYILSVPVKNMANLEESFNAFTDGEVISDFHCDNCDQKVEINKRCSFVDMPNVLMIHLQKIYFNMDTLMNEKIADRYEFPTYLNMKNYMINNIAKKHGINDPDLHKYAENEDKNFEYRLVGVIIHQGVAEAGHYYSLICTDPKVRDSKEQEWTTTENLKWTEFNDTSIRDFNFRSNFEDECFGKNSKDVYGPSTGYDDWGMSGGSSKSAYVLIYEKRELNDIRLDVDMALVRQNGKTPEQVEEAEKEERRKYLASIYSSHNYDPPAQNSQASEGEEVKDAELSFMSSLECGNIAVPRDLFPYLVIPHNISVFMSQEQRNKLKFIPVQYDKDENKCHIRVKFKEVQKYIPYKFLKKVWDDNNAFSSERLINNSDFFALFSNMLDQEDFFEMGPDKEKCDLLFDLTFTLMFNMLPYVYYNSRINQVSRSLDLLISCTDHGYERIVMDKLLEDNSSEIIRIFFKSGDEVVRSSLCDVATGATKKMFNSDHEEDVEKAKKFLQNMINSIQTDAASNWTKFDAFF